MARQATDLPRSVAFHHGRLTSRPVSYGILNTFCCVKLRCVTVFDGVHPVLLRMSRSVTRSVITAREFYRYKMAYHGGKFLHIGAVTIMNNTDHTLHYAIEEELITIPNFLNRLCSRLLRSAVVIISKDLFVYKRKNCDIVWCLRFFRS